MNQKRKNMLTMFFSAWLLSACATSQPTAAINIQAASYLNPDINGQAAPVVISIYQLKSPFIFKTANYNALATNSASLLGDDLIDKGTMEIRPKEQRTLSINLKPNTKYLGIVAGYRRINQATWHSIINVPQGEKHIQIQVDLESQGLSAHRLQQSGFKFPRL